MRGARPSGVELIAGIDCLARHCNGIYDQEVGICVDDCFRILTVSSIKNNFDIFPVALEGGLGSTKKCKNCHGLLQCQCSIKSRGKEKPVFAI